jgi:hypothetical protein
MKPRETKLTHEELTRLLDYDPETGVFRWKVVTSNRVTKGQVAGSNDGKGHLLIRLNGTKYAAHRLAWFYVHKVWPHPEIDHINRVKDDNRIANLREATRNQNNRNVGIKRHNKSGFKGVCRHSQAKHKYQAQILVNGKKIYLGLFDTPEDAHAAYVAASEEHHGEYGVTH